MRRVELSRTLRMKELSVGAKGDFSFVVEKEHLANNFKDSILPPVLSTPVMIAAMENAALNAVKDQLERGETCLGTKIDVAHLRATPVGQQVTAKAELVRVENRRLYFNVIAHDETEKIGEGAHQRSVVESADIERRLEEKSAR